jgi:hypothetical protein
MNSHTNLMDHIPPVFHQHSDPRVEVIFITEALYHPTAAEQLIAQALSHCKHLNDPILECECFTQFFSFLSLSHHPMISPILSSSRSLCYPFPI